MNIKEITEGRVKNAYMTGTYTQSLSPTLPVQQMTHSVIINGKVWKDFPSEQLALNAANSIYNKNRRLRVNVVPK